jgi:DNA-binding MarR family transcriptional regulator
VATSSRVAAKSKKNSAVPRHAARYGRGVAPAANSDGAGQQGAFRLSYVIARLDRAIRRAIEDRLAPHGLTVPQYTAMSVLRNRPGLSNAQLARRSFVTPQSMNEVIASLEEGGLIKRDADPEHGRIRRARLTPKGRRLYERIDREIAELEEHMLAELSERERKRFTDAAVRCVHVLGAGLPDL